MTDKTQPDSGRATGGIVEMLHARIAELEARVQELGAMARENRSRRIVELEAQLEALRAALAASPTPPAEQQAAPKAAPGVGDELRDTLVAVSAAIAEQDARAAQKMIREILAASPTPPAEQQTQPGAVYAELPQPDSWFHFTPQYWENTLRDFADRTHALRMQAAPKAAPVVPRLTRQDDALCGYLADCDDNAITPDVAGAFAWAWAHASVAAPQQEAQEPIALLVRKNSWRTGQWEAAPPDSPSYGLAWADQRQYVYAAPQPVVQGPLTDEQIDVVMRKALGYGLSPSRDDLVFVRAIEHAHGITGDGK